MAKKKYPIKKMAKKIAKKAAKKKAKKITRSILCNTVTSDNKYYYYLNGIAGDGSVGCGNIEGMVLKSKVHEPVLENILCSDGRDIYRIRYKK